jgi:hypothetical protein
MHMQMRHGLTGGSAVIDTDVVTLRLKLFVQNLFGPIKQGQQFAALLL